ncbi:MAG: hypothetical protein RIR12_1748 [Bacteroidota bacterium]|jgi:ATP-binding cassette subfamily B protein
MKELYPLHTYFWKYRFRLGGGLLFVFLSNYFNVLSPQVTGFIIDYVQKKLQLPGYRPSSNLPKYDATVLWFIQQVQTINGVGKVVAICGISILGLALVRGFFLFLMRQTIIVMSRYIEYDQKNDIYQHYQKLDTTFYKANSTGDLMNRISEDVSRVRMFTGPAIMYLANLIAIISLCIFFMIKRSPTLTFYVLLPLPILAITIYFINNTIHKKSEKIQASLSSLTTNAQESYSGIRVIKSFVQEKAMLLFFSKNAEEYKKNALGLAKVEAIYFPSITLLIGISTLLTIMIGGLYYIHGTHQIGIETLVEFVMYINMLTFPVSAIGLTASMIQRAAASQKRINEFLQMQPAVQSSFTINQPVEFKSIELKQVDYTYPNTGIKAIKQINVTIHQGDRIAIVGRTGAGKSTFAQLLLRMFDPSTGNILVDGKPLNELDREKWRTSISYVPQDVFLFSDSVAQNIAFGLSHLDSEKVKTAAKMAMVSAEIENLPSQYNTVVGERGVTLSGGQKQRISIARAMAKNTSLVIFDDCLSAVDARTEKEIVENLNTYLGNKTAIIITHRIFSLLKFNKIIVMDNGAVIEQGTHEELLNRGGFYAEMYWRQQKGE